MSTLTPTTKPIEATWKVQLYAKCPHCEDSANLLFRQDFWRLHDFGYGEVDTPRTNDVPVTCPKCKGAFTVFCSF